MALVLRNHRRQERVDSEVVRNGVDFKDALDIRRRGLQDVSFEGNACIVDQDARVAVLGANGIGGGVHGFRRGDVALVVRDLLVRLHFNRKGVMDVKCHYSDTVRSEAFGDETAETTAGSSDDSDFLGPVVSVFLRFPTEVVLGQFREEAVQRGSHAKSEEPFERDYRAFQDCVGDICAQ